MSHSFLLPPSHAPVIPPYSRSFLFHSSVSLSFLLITPIGVFAQSYRASYSMLIGGGGAVAGALHPPIERRQTLARLDVSDQFQLSSQQVADSTQACRENNRLRTKQKDRAFHCLACCWGRTQNYIKRRQVRSGAVLEPLRVLESRRQHAGAAAQSCSEAPLRVCTDPARAPPPPGHGERQQSAVPERWMSS